MRISIIIVVAGLLCGCSHLQQLDTETKVLGVALGTAAAVELAKVDNGGVTHGVISFGVSHATETFADQCFSEPEQEWAADTLAIIGAAVSAVYYRNRESGNSIDSKADWMLPLGNLIYTTWQRLRYEQ